MVITYSKSKNQPGKVANPGRGQLNRENEYFPSGIDFVILQERESVYRVVAYCAGLGAGFCVLVWIRCFCRLIYYYFGSRFQLCFFLFYS